MIEIDGGHTLTDAAFTAHHDQLVLDAGHAGLHLLHLLGDLLNDLGVVGIAELSQNCLEILFRSHERDLWLVFVMTERDTVTYGF